MTPKRFFDTEGGAFAFTILDNRAGLSQGDGNYVMAPEKTRVKTIPPAQFSTIREYAEDGQRKMEAGDFLAAFELFTKAIKLLPEPWQCWNAAGWLLVALGENAIRAGNFEAAESPLDDAMWCPGTIGNPWVHMRLGQVRFELGQMDRAADELARAYMGGGREVFEGQDPKYFELVEKVLLPPPGMDHLP